MTIILTWQRLALWCALVALVAFAVAGWLWNPVEQTADHVVAPVARSVGIGEGRCHDGWEDISDRTLDTQTFICAKGNWRVVLKPDGKTFDHAVELQNPQAQFLFAPELVPGW